MESEFLAQSLLVSPSSATITLLTQRAVGFAIAVAPVRLRHDPTSARFALWEMLEQTSPPSPIRF